MINKTSTLNIKLITQMLAIPENWPAWRKRRILQIIPKDSFCYRLKTSYQFSLPLNFLENNSDKTPIRLKWPIDSFPKGVLLNFSVWNSNGHRCTVETRYESTNLTYAAVLEPQLAVLLQEYQSQNLLVSIEFFERLLRAIIMQQLTKKKIENKSTTLETLISYWKKSLDAFPDHYKCLISKENDIRNLLSKIHNLSWGGLTEGKFSNMPLNPLLVTVDYLKLHSREVGNSVEEGIEAYLRDCNEYLDFLLKVLKLEPELYKEIIKRIKIVSEIYYLFIPVEIIAGQDFLIKTEQLIPTKTQWGARYLAKKLFLWILGVGSRFIEKDSKIRDRQLIPPQEQGNLWCRAKNLFLHTVSILGLILRSICNGLRRGYCKFNSMEYQIDLGKDASTHIEVECPEPNEVSIVPSRCYVGIKNDLLPAKDFFRYNSGESGSLQHYYTSKCLREVHNATGSDKAGVTLWIKYSLNWKITFLYFIGMAVIIVITALMLLKNNTANVLPIFISLGATFVLTLRSKEPYVELYLNPYKWIILILTCISLMAFAYTQLHAILAYVISVLS